MWILLKCRFWFSRSRVESGFRISDKHPGEANGANSRTIRRSNTSISVALSLPYMRSPHRVIKAAARFHCRDSNLIDLESSLAIRIMWRHPGSKAGSSWQSHILDCELLQVRVCGSDLSSSLWTLHLEHYGITALFTMSSVCLKSNMTSGEWKVELLLFTSNTENEHIWASGSHGHNLSGP